MGSILATGYLNSVKHRTQTRSEKYNIISLEEKHLPFVMALQEVIVKNLGSPDLLQSFSYDFMKQHMGSKGFVLGVFVGNRLAAFRNVYYPDPWDREWNLGLDIGLTGARLCHVVNLQMVCVHPRFRGNALAMKMNQIALGMLRERGTHHHVCATVSPYNIWNIPVLLANGFYIVTLKEKYGGKLRYVVYQDLRKPLLFDDNSSEQVSLADLESQKKILAKGLYGTDLIPKKNIHRQNPAHNLDLVFKSPAQGRWVPIHWNTPFLWDPAENAAKGQDRRSVSP